MKFLIAIIILFSRLYIGYKILSWMVAKSLYPKLHTISEIELFIVLILFDIWICTSHGDVEVKINKKED